MRVELSFLFSIVALAWSVRAHAQEVAPVAPVAPAPDTPPPSAPRPALPPADDTKITLTTTPLPERTIEHRSYHVHDGFYLRMSIGFGDYRASYSDAHRSNQDFSGRGSSMSLDLLIGGSPSPGIAIGGGLLADPLFGLDYARNGLGVGSHGGASVLIGPFFDGFPDSTRGWHLGGLIGVGGQSFQNVNAPSSSSARASGVGGAAWFGYDFWVAGEWAVGPQLRLMGLRASDTKSGEDISSWARSFTLGVSGVFN